MSRKSAAVGTGAIAFSPLVDIFVFFDDEGRGIDDNFYDDFPRQHVLIKTPK